ncbi:Dolichyl-phosphoglucose-dependent alpha-1,2 glucosyltransferase/ALG10/DIE2 [Blumeria hordei DH14]|uniref:Dol-P-Glc:Glc(2)Man(9)GlcNAc(2)-PP-Dol alpha-1,2-glucosyltransferase n=1 Tax=Blumeria graminis f. sp. hordei (strain DH14) TaxID=546991 RepID=N1JHY7_BLUG1|nr:Dolichyl-phosphoglucose-dependent alpha-1,2 glucosyltransferase/ALG10/DIE2 [Blumeria hordei DH14]
MALFWDYFAAKSLISSLSRRIALQRSSTYFLFIPALSYTLSLYWEHCVSKLVPKPYLDEVFHIRQAQAYCHGNYTVWDPKITTPPALAFSKQFCSIHQLRLFNCHALLLTFYYAYGCRRRIVRKWARNRYLLDVDALHTAFNITLFPPLFFFSGLFYTDVLSTCCVLVSYKLYLERNDERTNLRLNLLCSFIIGIVCLLIRQTNIFWVAIFLGALQLVDTIKLHQIKEEILKSSIIRNQYISKFLKEYCILKLHDPSLEEAGDKSNHVATIHLPQMLYLWPLITFFSAPLLIPAGISFFRRLNHQIPRHVFISISWSNLQSALHITGGLIVCLATIKYNTIIHPFTLADNRHYMFYIFRYSILCHPAIRFLLAPIYAICSALPRYFITCWVLWRLNIPMNLSKELVSENKTSDSRTNNLFFKALKKPYSSMCHKKWLWLETTWLILINFITGYIFLHKGFEWPQEPGNVQRFMW